MIARVAGQVLSGHLRGDDPADVVEVATWALPGSLSSALICRFRLRSSADAVRVRDAPRRRWGR